MSKIMLVEDDPTMLSLLRTLLQMEGFEVVQSKEEQLDKVFQTMQQEKPALALVDVHLHHASGFDLLDKIRNNPELASTHVLMSSGMDFRMECIEAGADGFILKPYMPDELIQIIRETLKQ